MDSVSFEAPAPRPLALPLAAVALLAGGGAAAAAALPRVGGIRIAAALVLGVALAGAAASLDRARRSAAEAAGWRWTAASCLGMALQGVLVLLIPSLGWAAEHKQPLWFSVTAFYQVCGALALATWPWRRRTLGRALQSGLGASIFCSSILVILWSAVDWAALAGQAPFARTVFLTTSLRICLFGGISLYLLSDRPARWRGPLGWYILHAVGGGGFAAVLYAHRFQGQAWAQGPLVFVTVASASMAFLSAWSNVPVEPPPTPRERPALAWNQLPYAAFVLACVQVLAHHLRHPADSGIQALALAGILVPLLWRQVLLDRDLAAALTDLEARVEARTLDLEAAKARLVEEVGERSRAEAAQERHAAHLRTLLNTIPDLVWHKDALGRYRGCNLRFEDLVGRPEGDILGCTDEALLPAGTAEAFRANDLQAVVARGPVTAEETLTFPDGRVVTLETVRTPIMGPGGELLGVLGVGRDIGQRLRLEAERRRLERQVAGSQRLESLGGLAGGIAHDMNNVLGAILMMASAHEEQLPEDSRDRKAFGTIALAAERGGQMVKSLLNFARQAPMERTELDLNTVLKEVAQLLERTTLARVRLDLRLEPGLAPILGDAGTLSHAVMNLCVNAVDAMGGEGTLRLETASLPGGGVEARVTDTGCGMDADVLSRAMDPFFTTKEVGRGTGLGLSMVYGVMRAHQGEVEIRSEPGHGTCVTLRFPPPEAAAAAAAEPPAAAWRPLSLLVVDDDELVRRGLEELLEGLGHACVCTSRGEEALARLEAGGAWDAVLLDLNMPGLGGPATLARMRQARPGLPIVLITGKADRIARELVGEHPGVVLLPKPFNGPVLQRALAAAAG
ncbi:hybrid sensor histidine kinase/response regulator [Mesoterricola sediminis]|uniref:histidine kinase n=1 Tax=Mesoterricola sediminis TaxID=2927980 RepID=A0AA48GT11_9BACT|nr:ATP-binding protein [Mesoterricola sediminis]BDU77154.1 hypothetical protein METESE_21120 [Mesoterricola sediminis]